MSTVKAAEPSKTIEIKKFNKTGAQVKKVISELQVLTDISSPAELERTMITLKTAKDIEKAIEQKRTELVKPFNDKVKTINAFAKSLTAELTSGIDAGKKLVIAYNQQEEQRAKDQRKAVRIQQLISLGMILSDNDGNPHGYSYGGTYIPLSAIENYSEHEWEAIYTEALTCVQSQKNREVNQLQSDLETARFFSTEEEVAEIKEKIQSLSESPAVETVTVSTPAFNSVKGSTKRWSFEITDTNIVPREYLAVDEKKIREAVTAGTRDIPGVRIFQADGLTIR